MSFPDVDMFEDLRMLRYISRYFITERLTSFQIPIIPACSMKTLVVACFLTVIALGAEGSSDTTDRGECPDYSVYSRYPQ